MKRGWLLVVFGIALIVLSVLLMRGGSIVDPVLDDTGSPVMVDGRIVLRENRMKTILLNWDAWLSMGLGVTLAVAGLYRMRME